MNAQILNYQEKKEQFVILRASGNSFRAIGKKLGISKDTGRKWEKELSSELLAAKSERLEVNE